MVLAERFLLEETIERGLQHLRDLLTMQKSLLAQLPSGLCFPSHTILVGMHIYLRKWISLKKWWNCAVNSLRSHLRFWQSSPRNLSPEALAQPLKNKSNLGRQCSRSNKTSKQAVLIERLVISPWSHEAKVTSMVGNDDRE